MRRLRREALGLVTLLLVLVGTACALLVAAQDGPAARTGLRVGLVANAMYGGPGELALANRLGVGWVREEFRWNEVERVKGRYDWTVTDRLMRSATARGLKVLPMLYLTPRHVERDILRLPRDTGAYARFGAAVVARYGPGGDFWAANPRLDERLAPRWYELWNEPYLEQFSTGGTNPARYARMVVEASAAMKATNPQALVVMAGETTHRPRSGGARPWIEDLFRAEPTLAAAIDAVAVHPYAIGSPAGQRRSREEEFTRIDDIVRSLREAGATRQKLWITEIGWSTCERRPACVSRADQARHLRTMFGLVEGRYRDVVDAVFVYHLRDQVRRTRADRRDTQKGYGLVGTPGNARKPAWDVVRRAALRAR